MTDEDLIVDLNRLFWLLEEDRQYCSRTDTVKFAARRIEAQAAEIERLRGALHEVNMMINAENQTNAERLMRASLFTRSALTGDKT